MLDLEKVGCCGVVIVDNFDEKPLLGESFATHSRLGYHVFQAFDCKWFSRRLMHWLYKVLLALIPSFLQQAYSREPMKSEKLHPTAYLDGIRGLAAFIVFLCHLSYGVFDIRTGYNKGHEEVNRRRLYLPIIRLFYSGPVMVAVFFIISGFSLSYKPLKQMQSGAYSGLLETLSSSVFRRGIRLFLPCIVSTFLILILVRLGAYEYTRPTADNGDYMRGVHEHHIARFGTLCEQLQDWAAKIFDFLHVWDWMIFGGTIDYDHHLWTIPVEFKASMALFISHLALARLRPFLRISAFLGLAIWAMKWDRWEMILFWVGASLAELNLLHAASVALAAKTPTEAPLHTPIGRCRALITATGRLLWALTLFTGLYLASYPDIDAGTTPGYIYLRSLVPPYWGQEYRFWQSAGAILVMATITYNNWLQSLFISSLMQYLGKISFSLYLVHGFCTHTFGYLFMQIMWGALGTDNWFKFQFGFAIAACFTVIFTIWVADVFWRVVDLPCVRLGKWLEAKCTVNLNIEGL